VNGVERPEVLLAAAIKERGLTQRAAAAILGVSEAFMSDLVHGRRRYTAALAVRVQHAFDIPASELLWRQAGVDLQKELASAKERNGK
jgi:plasmid maintenance system antidote protein VapI